MKNKGIVIFLLTMAAAIVVLFVVDYRSQRPGKSKANPFSLDIEEYKSVDSSLIRYRESRNFKIGMESPAAIKITDDKIYVAGDNQLKIISLQGILLSELTFQVKPLVLEVSGERIYIATKNQVSVYNLEGNLMAEWQPFDGNTHITAMAAAKDFLFIADAGKRKIYKYSHDGNMLSEIDGKAVEGALHGFIIPSPSFDIGINSENELWAVNPGLHSLENYTFDGRLRGHWKQSGVNTEGFSGCCNPGYFTFLNDDRFITSEKGLVRIKIYRQSGEFESVVAAPGKFADEGHAPDVAADSENNIYALDFNTKMIRVFVPVAGTGVVNNQQIMQK